MFIIAVLLLNYAIPWIMLLCSLLFSQNFFASSLLQHLSPAIQRAIHQGVSSSADFINFEQMQVIIAFF